MSNNSSSTAPIVARYSPEFLAMATRDLTTSFILCEFGWNPIISFLLFVSAKNGIHPKKYIVIGALIVLTNLPIFVAILAHSPLRMRKEYLMIASLALVDFLNGAGCVSAGIYRLYLITNGVFNLEKSHLRQILDDIEPADRLAMCNDRS